MALLMFSIISIVMAVKALFPDASWWHWLLGMLPGILLAVLGVVALNALLEFIEYLTIAPQRCASCGSRRWSWGSTRGFGL